MIDKCIAEFLVQVGQYLGIAFRDELKSVFLQLRTHLAVVVQLAVHHHDDRPVLAKHRLVARLQIDDRQPPHPQRDRLIRPQPLRIRPAMHDSLTHRVQHRLGVLIGFGCIQVDPTCYSAHLLTIRLYHEIL